MGEDRKSGEETLERWVCPNCGKVCVSGKALGGHMRVHPKNKNKDKQKLGIIIKKNDGENVCAECGKKFPSVKSLFGHMRSHPDRHWRGIRPPPDAVAPPSPLPKWAVTGKRGRRGTGGEDDPGVYFLLMMAYGRRSSTPDHHNHPIIQTNDQILDPAAPHDQILDPAADDQMVDNPAAHDQDWAAADESERLIKMKRVKFVMKSQSGRRMETIIT